MDKPDCQFCDFPDREVVIHEDETAFAIISHQPINKYHILVIPRKHYESFIELPDDVATHLFLLTKRLSAAVRQVCHPDAVTHISEDDVKGSGYNLVAHYKIHIIPRYKDDKIEIRWNRDEDPGLEVRSIFARELRETLERIPIEYPEP